MKFLNSKTSQVFHDLYEPCLLHNTWEAECNLFHKDVALQKQRKGELRERQNEGYERTSPTTYTHVNKSFIILESRAGRNKSGIIFPSTLAVFNLFSHFYTILKKLNENLSTRKSHFTDSERENWERYKTRGYEWNSPHYLKLDQIEPNQLYGTFRIMRP